MSQCMAILASLDGPLASMLDLHCRFSEDPRTSDQQAQPVAWPTCLANIDGAQHQLERYNHPDVPQCVGDELRQCLSVYLVPQVVRPALCDDMMVQVLCVACNCPAVQPQYNMPAVCFYTAM